MSARASRTVTLALGHACCTGVLCVHGGASAREVDRALARGGRRLVLRGVAVDDPRAAALVARAHRSFDEVVLVTAELDRLRDEASLRALVAARLDAVRAVLFSHVPTVHDRLAGRERALGGALFAMRRLAASGVPLEVEAPVLPRRLSDPGRLVALLGRAVEDLRALRLFVPAAEVPDAVAPPAFDAIEAPLRRAVEAAEEAGARVRFDPSQGFVHCAFGEAPAMLARFAFRGRSRDPMRALAAPCRSCAVADRCGGPTEAYRRVHGGDGLSPFATRPAALSGRPARARPTWGPAEREAARRVSFLVLRPTVHCNQDCLFCSANESSRNVWRDDKAMLRAIVRAAQRGVRRISFSGGEPTLSPSLPAYVHAAHRLGVPEIEIVTNGVLLDREAKARRLADAGLTHAFVSLHAHDEALSRAMTQKVGDHARTLAAIEHLLDAGVLVAVNHVVTRRNRAYLEAFVEMLHARFGGRVFLSFAFVTPQYKALEHPELVPRLSDTAPYLHRAMRAALARGQPFVVGARQGVPPCFLGPFAAWSDVFHTEAEAASEDAPQKVQGPACGRCRYRAICQGVWRPYAARHGFDELVPVEGPAWTEAELAAIRGHHRPPPWGVPTRFEEAPALLRDRGLERAPPPPLPASTEPVRRLPVHGRTRPLRGLWIGTGGRARRLAERAAALDGWALTAVASPHAPDAPGWWGAVPAFRDAAAAMDETRPEVAVIAAATEAHPGLATACARAGVPALLEKPVARSGREARALLEALGDGAWTSCALQELFEPGLEDLLGTPGPMRVIRRCPPEAPDAPRAWGRAPLLETVHHALTVPVTARGPLVAVERVRFEGTTRPTRLVARLRHADGPVELALDFAAPADELALEVGPRRWVRRGPDVTLDGAAVERRGSAEARMLEAFGRAVLDGASPPVPLARGVAILEATEALLDAVEAAGAPLRRPGAPKHVASRRYRTGVSGR